jgi:hypothetical protein
MTSSSEKQQGREWSEEAVDVLARRIARRRPHRKNWEHSDVRHECRQIARKDLLALDAFLPATQQSGDGLEQALGDAIELAQEGWGYASTYFCEKWDSQGRIERLQEVLDASRASGGGGE